MKATEHFDLPLATLQEGVYQSDGTDEPVAEFNTTEQAQIAARAINHADKLAEALDGCADLIGLTPVDKGSQRLFEVYQKALGALKAYRSAE